MEKIKNSVFLIFLLILTAFSSWPAANAVAQEKVDRVLSFTEYIGMVKKYHPRMRQANLEISKAEAGLMVARGAFDPKIEVDFDRKQFKGTEYYSLLNSTFKIPVWYGIEIKAGFDNFDGSYLNPENTIPASGLATIGLSLPLAQGLAINQRMADLKTAKVQLRIGRAEQQLAALNTLYDASLAYFHWLSVHNERELYREYLDLAIQRSESIKSSIRAGDKPAIDSTEAGIVVKNRQLSLEDANLKLIKAKLEISNYLWIDQVPVELQDSIIPENDLDDRIAQVLGVSVTNGENLLAEHPKMIALQGKIDTYNIERKLKANQLLPRIDLGYNYLSESLGLANFIPEDYKFGLNMSFPLFLRKERGNLRLTRQKILDSELNLDIERQQLKNKIDAGRNEISTLRTQISITGSLVSDYTRMLQAEERLFSAGESSVFLINSRENSLLSSRLAQINIENKFLNANASLMQLMGRPSAE